MKIQRSNLQTGKYYHVFNRGIDRRNIFLRNTDYLHFESLINYYRFEGVVERYSYFRRFPRDKRNKMWGKIKRSPQIIKCTSYCFMPNHFHLLLKQTQDNGIYKFIFKIQDAYAKYSNIKYGRKGRLFESRFKFVVVETEEQFLHLSRYIHLNPATSSIVDTDVLETYLYSSLPAYLGLPRCKFVDTKDILYYFRNKSDYKKFIVNHAGYQKNLHKIKHLILEGDVL